MYAGQLRIIRRRMYVCMQVRTIVASAFISVDKSRVCGHVGVGPSENREASDRHQPSLGLMMIHV